MPRNRSDLAIAWSDLKEDAVFEELRAVLRRGLHESDPLELKALQKLVAGDKASVRCAIDKALDGFGEGAQLIAARRLFRATDDTRHLRGLDRARLAAVEALNDPHVNTAGALRRAPLTDEDAGGWEWQVLRAVWKGLHLNATTPPSGGSTGTTKDAGRAPDLAPTIEADELPAVPGREGDLASVVADIAHGRSVVIRGAPGLGKTTLLQAVHGAYPDAVSVRLEQGGEAMRDLRLALHRQTGGEFPVDDDQGIALIAMGFPNGAVVLVDNADEPESAEAIRRLSGHVPDLVFVVTSRGQSFPGFRTLDLPPLSRSVAEALLTDFDLSPSNRDAVMSRGAGNPLVLKQEAWAAVEGGDVMDDDDRLGRVLRLFDGAERRVLWLIGELPSAVLPRGLVTNVGGLTQRGLDLLRRNAVANAVGDGYEFHETLRAACREVRTTVRDGEIRQLREDAAQFYIDWLDADPGLAAIDRALPDLMHLLDTASKAESRTDLTLALIGDRLDDPVGYIPSRGLAGLLLEKLDPLRATAAEVGGVKAARLEKNLGLFCHWGDDPAAEELVLSARSRFRDASDDDGRAGATWVLGIIADDSCNYAQAEALYREPLTWLHDPAARAVGHHLTGCSLYHQGRYEEAREAFTRALGSTEDRVVLSRTTRRLSYVDLLVGDAREAIDGLRAIRERSLELNRPRDVARIERHIGEAYLRLGDADEADTHFTAAKEIFEQVGDKRGLGATLLGLASTRRLQERLDEAGDLVKLSRAIANGGNESPAARLVSPVGVARAAEEEGRIAAAHGDASAAVRHLRRACNIYETIGHARADVLATELGEERDAHVPRPRGVLFDLVDTLAETSESAYEDAKLRLSHSLGVDHDHFKAAWARSRRQASIDASWSPRSRIEWVARELGVSLPDDTLDELADAERALWTSGVQLKPEALDTLERIRGAGIKVALVSNGTSAMRGLPEILGLDSILTATVVSSTVGVLKPHAGIYERALEELGLAASECVYVGDGSDRELEGAQAVGLFAIRIQAGPKPKYNTKHSLNWDATVHSLHELIAKLGV